MQRRKFIIWLASAVIPGPLTALTQPSGAAGKHNLSLTRAQRSAIWHALRKDAGKTQEPAGLNVGEAVPDTMNVLSFDHNLRKKIRALRPYRYTLLHGRVLIVDPETKKIIAIVGR